MRAERPVEGDVELPCMACGSRELDVTRPGLAQGVSDWLRFGGRWRPRVRVCRRCGHVSSAASARWLVAHRRGWWSAPGQLVGTLRRRRTMMPVPATYLMATAAGVVLGLAAQLLVGWPWWLVAAAVLAAVWLFFTSTALWGRRGSRRPLATELLMAVAPDRAVQRERRDQVERFRRAPFPLYGLPPAWPGPRYLGGWEGSWAKGGGPATTALDLGHGDPLADQGPQLRVEVRVDPDQAGRAPGARRWRRRRLAEDLWLAAAPATHDVAEHVEQVAAARRRPDPAWSPAPIPVDGRPVAFEWLAEGRHWVAVADLDHQTLVLQARDLPVDQVELVRVADLGPYVEGTRRLDEAQAGPLDQEH